MAIQLEKGYVATLCFMITGGAVGFGVMNYFDGHEVFFGHFYYWLFCLIFFIALCIYTHIKKEWLERVVGTGIVLLLFWLASLL